MMSLIIFVYVRLYKILSKTLIEIYFKKLTFISTFFIEPPECHNKLYENKCSGMIQGCTICYL